jgi:mRNA-degrading endonuclease RelE of RelBE toxin-antitoxin system
MAFEIIMQKKCEKFMQKLEMANPKEHYRIHRFITQTLCCVDNPLKLHNCKAIVGSKYYYRWRLGDYRLIGDAEQNGKIIIVRVESKGDTTYKKGL